MHPARNESDEPAPLGRIDGRPFVLVLGTVLLLLVALAVLHHGVERGRLAGAREPSAEFLRSRERWQAANVRAYSATVERRCECDGRRIRIEVRDGVLARATSLEDGAAVPVRGYQAPPTVELLFAQLASGYREGFSQVSAKFDPQLGYPIEVQMDKSADVVDDEFTLSLTDFVAGAGDPP